MRVRLRFLGVYSVLTGKKEDVVEFPAGTTAYEFLNMLSQRYGPSFKNQVIDEKGKLRSDCRFFLGEEEISRSQLDSEMTEEDATLFFLGGVEGGTGSPLETNERVP